MRKQSTGVNSNASAAIAMRILIRAIETYFICGCVHLFRLRFAGSCDKTNYADQGVSRPIELMIGSEDLL